MSKADEMFEKLGYEIRFYNRDIVYKEKNNSHEITFYIKRKCVSSSRGIGSEFINMKELQAINEKCKELRMDLKKEWKEIKGYEGKYIISNYGEIISLPRYKQNNSKLQYVEPKEIKRYVNLKNGYVYVQLWNNSKYKNIRLHKLVAEAFIPNLNNLPQINHIDGDKQNNRIDNLEWCTARDNILHSYKIGLRKRGG